MNFGNFSFLEILMLLVAVLLAFGAKRIPEIAGSLGKGISEFKRNLSDAQRQITEPPRPPERVGGPAAEAVGEDRPEPKRLMQ
jgi:sec-independent protein translocase protein TatA